MWHAAKAVPTGKFLPQIAMLILDKIIYKKPLYYKLAVYFFIFYILYLYFYNISFTKSYIREKRCRLNDLCL